MFAVLFKAGMSSIDAGIVAHGWYALECAPRVGICSSLPAAPGIMVAPAAVAGAVLASRSEVDAGAISGAAKSGQEANRWYNGAPAWLTTSTADVQANGSNEGSLLSMLSRLICAYAQHIAEGRRRIKESVQTMKVLAAKWAIDSDVAPKIRFGPVKRVALRHSSDK